MLRLKNKLTDLIVSLGLLTLTAQPVLAEILANDLRIGVTKERTRLVLDLSDSVSYKIFLLDKPRRVVIDLPMLKWSDKASQAKPSGLIKGLRVGQFSPTQSRMVIDAGGPVAVSKIFLIEPVSGLAHRLVIDLVKSNATKFARQVAAERARKVSKAPSIEVPAVRRPGQKRKKNARRVVVIDAGHGGVDTGARGRSAREKDVTLAFAREFTKRLRQSGKYKVYLTRNRDIYIPLRQRVNIARKHDADLFISIHADAIKRKSVRGMSIYTLSETASDKEAEALALKENRSDIIAGVNFGDHEPVVADILIDLAQRETKNQSIKFAKLVVNNARGSTRLIERTHRFAGFRVLKAPDVPSVLIELGFLTNRSDEKRLLSSSWRKKVAAALVRSVAAYFEQDQIVDRAR